MNHSYYISSTTSVTLLNALKDMQHKQMLPPSESDTLMTFETSHPMNHGSNNKPLLLSFGEDFPNEMPLTEKKVQGKMKQEEQCPGLSPMIYQNVHSLLHFEPSLSLRSGMAGDEVTQFLASYPGIHRTYKRAKLCKCELNREEQNLFFILPKQCKKHWIPLC